MAADSCRRSRLTEWWFAASQCLANTDGMVCKWRLKDGDTEGRSGGGMQWDVFVWTETLSKPKWKQSVSELKEKIMGQKEGTRWREAIEVKWENTWKIQWMGREWAELRKGAVYQREEGSERERDRNRREIDNRRGSEGMGEGAVKSETDSDRVHNGERIR